MVCARYISTESTVEIYIYLYTYIDIYIYLYVVPMQSKPLFHYKGCTASLYIHLR